MQWTEAPTSSAKAVGHGYSPSLRSPRRLSTLLLSHESRLRWPDRAAMATRPAGRSGRVVRGAPGRTALNLADSQRLLARSGVRVGLISGGLPGLTQVSAGERRD